jgi:hypothetical protein
MKFTPYVPAIAGRAGPVVVALLWQAPITIPSTKHPTVGTSRRIPLLPPMNVATT